MTERDSPAPTAVHRDVVEERGPRRCATCQTTLVAHIYTGFNCTLQLIRSTTYICLTCDPHTPVARTTTTKPGCGPAAGCH
ncbi:hypothetical protein Val02_12890 [Virgisporangium aliadipatigenens]|uniref:Uncharacterized protein n=1 Tax=Virgisporangium aliadipatigenens TaxID=741659 RepID=A0A8J3YHN9_9ACTN|nr:hypothetical protein Val02_12890 [Virgisporangium aliadipatigenens]